MLTGKHKIYWIIRKLLGYLLLLEVVWLIINCVSPWRLWRNADIIVVCTLPWILIFFLIRYIKRRWKEDGNAADSTKITFEDDKYQVTIIEALFATQMDKIQIMEHCGPFYHKVYSSDLYDVDTDKLKSKAAIEDFLKEQEREK